MHAQQLRQNARLHVAHVRRALPHEVARGYVVDMFDFHWGIHHFPVFNVADSYITVAAALMLVLGFFQKDAEKGAEKKRGAA